MRPRLLEIEGLQSFTIAQVIDFDTLGETGLFGIFGPTGSGKSTILDAITFALYGRVKRAENGTQGIINSGCRTVRVSFTFDLSKNGKRTTYRVERTYQRKKNSPNACEPKIARLIEVTDDGEIPLCDKATEVTNAIRELIGLGNEDFTRAVVLPQNSFHEFLMLKNSERRGMLERIFYLEEYGKLLNEKVTRKMAALRSRIDLLTGELMGYADASDEALEEAKKAMEAADEDRNRTEKELKRMESLYNESKEVWGLMCELNDLIRKEGAHRLSETEISGKRIQLEKAVRADGLTDMIRENKELEDKLKQTQTELKDIMDVLPAVKEKLAATKAEYEKVKQEAAADQQRLVEQRTRLKDALGIKEEITSLTARFNELSASLTGVLKKIETKNADIAAENKELASLKDRLEKLTAQCSQLRTEPEYRQQIQQGAVAEKEAAALAKSLEQLLDRKNALLKTIGELEHKLEGVTKEIADSINASEVLDESIKKHESEKPGDRDSLLLQMEKVHKARSVYQVLKLRESEAKLSRSRSEAISEELEKMKIKAAELEKARSDASAVYENYRRELDECLRELNNNAACTLSRLLKEGEPCPVCGSLEHPSPAVGNASDETAMLEQKAEDARSRLADAETSLRKAENEALVFAENVKAVLQQLEQAVKDAELKEREYEEERQKLPEEWKSLEPEQILQKIDRYESNIKAKQQAIEAWEAKLTELKEQQTRCAGALAELKITEKSISTELRVNNNNLSRLEEEIGQTSKNLSEVRQETAKYLEKYQITGCTAELARLAENDRKLGELESETEKTRKAAEEVKGRIDFHNEEMARLSEEKARLETDLSAMDAQRREKERKLYELAAGADIEEGIRLIDERLRSFAEADRKYSLIIEELEKQYNDLAISKSNLDSRISLYTERLAADRERLNTALADNGFSGSEEVLGCILPQDVQKAMKAEIEKYDQELMNIQAQKGMVQKKLKSRTITEEEWNRLENSYMELLEHSKRIVSESEVAKSNFSNILKKHNRWKELQRLLADTSHRHGLYEQIQKLLKAGHGKDNSFIDFIAEERLRYVAAKASSILGVMTGHRYALELDAESGFIIRDDANGGIHRMVTTLSGGETFLTSLSLALALSEQIQLKGQSPLEFFFLDEGFGTLDQELLDTVMDSLERLSSGDRVIGIISHVPELRQRIGRRLSVRPPDFEGTGSTVLIEKA